MPITNDTICALATPVGKGGVSVIRVSGSNALPLCQVLTGLQPTPRQAVLGSFRARGGELIDNGLVLYFKAPHSFTGEDVCEFHCHGSPMVVDQVLTFLVAHGARLARPGEFSERAFLNDKLDLTQAEAIADLIDSASISAARHAIRSLQGYFSQLVHQLVSQLVELRAYVEAAMDFADEEIDFLGAGNVRSRLVALMTTLQQIQLQAKQGSLLREGLKVVMAGAPNAGKSTLLNALIGQDRTIVSNIPGTTRDSIHTQYKLFGKEFILIDTAGLRKKKNVHEDLEFYSVIRAIKAMDEADICMMIIDAEKGITAQDISIFSLAARKGKGIVIMMNKWDLVEKETNTARDYEAMIKQRIAPFNDVPVIFISATEKQRIFQGIEKALQVFDARNRRIKTSALNDAMLKEIQYYPPPMSRGHAVKIKFATQLPTAFPTFVFFANHPDAIKDAYKKFLENKIRSHFDFNGVPIRIFFRKK